jgi:alpha-maltose-1-phosphate synthase
VRRAIAAGGPPDVLHVYTQSIALRSADLLAAFPSVVSTDATSLQGAYHLPHRRPTRFTSSAVRVAQLFERKVYEAATLVVAQSEWVADSLRRAYGVVDDRIRVIPFGLTLGPEPVRREPEGLPEVTFVGATLDRKGGWRLLRVFREHLRGRCVLNLVTRDAVEPEPGVRVLNDFEPGDPRLPELLARTSVFAFPTEMDNSPYSVLEAMRAGIPVVATRVGALPEMVEDGTWSWRARSARCSTTRGGCRRWARPAASAPPACMTRGSRRAGSSRSSVKRGHVSRPSSRCERGRTRGRDVR